MIRCLSVALLCLSEVAAAQTGASRSDESGYTKALQQFQSGNYASAAKLFEDVEAASPGTTDSLLYEAKALIHLQDFSRSESALRSYIHGHRESSDALYLLGFVLHRLNRPAESLETYSRAAAIT